MPLSEFFRNFQDILKTLLSISNDTHRAPRKKRCHLVS